MAYKEHSIICVHCAAYKKTLDLHQTRSSCIIDGPLPASYFSSSFDDGIQWSTSSLFIGAWMHFLRCSMRFCLQLGGPLTTCGNLPLNMWTPMKPLPPSYPLSLGNSVYTLRHVSLFLPENLAMLGCKAITSAALRACHQLASLIHPLCVSLLQVQHW